MCAPSSRPWTPSTATKSSIGRGSTAPVRTNGTSPTSSTPRSASIWRGEVSFWATISGAERTGITSSKTWQRLSPGRPIVEIANKDAIFHTVFDLDERYQVSGEWSLGGLPYLNGGSDPHWRAIYDDKGRILVSVLFNHDTGDSWEWADDPSYPEQYSALGIRTGVNYVVYAMTH